jgi:protoporphyrin/coproporphyrin ferrochelatase
MINGKGPITNDNGPRTLNQDTNGDDRASHSVAVVLFQLGGPDSLEAIEPFLYNLFSDPDIIDFPFARLARPTLARLIASRRARHVQEHYARIGGRSPIRELTERQAAALERELCQTMDARCFVAMRYWNPSTADAIRQVQARPFHPLVLLPLYPQYSKTTTGSSLNEWHRQYNDPTPSGSEARVISEFHTHPLYIDAVTEKINLGLERFLGTGEPTVDDVHLVFSAHGVPLKEIERGDPYQAQIESTVRAVMDRGHWPNPHWLCYQSRLGPGKWLEPSLQASLRQVAAGGRKRVLVIPISFVTDHVETLYEIDIEARALAGKLGIRQFEVMPALNDSPTFIRALTELVRKAVESDTTNGFKLNPQDGCAIVDARRSTR